MAAAKEKEHRSKTEELGEDFDQHIENLRSFMCNDDNSDQEL